LCSETRPNAKPETVGGNSKEQNMKHLLLILTLPFFSFLQAQETSDTLTYARTVIIVPEGCSAKSKFEIIGCNGFSAQWLYLKQEMIDQGVDKQLFSQLEQQLDFTKKSSIKFKSQGEAFEGYQYKIKNGTSRILGLGKVNDQWLILNLGFDKAPRKNDELSAFEKNFIEL